MSALVQSILGNRTLTRGGKHKLNSRKQIRSRAGYLLSRRIFRHPLVNRSRILERACDLLPTHSTFLGEEAVS